MRGINFDGVPEAPKPKRKRKKRKVLLSRPQQVGYLQAAIVANMSQFEEGLTQAFTALLQENRKALTAMSSLGALLKELK